MSENNINDKILPATLQEGEPVITKEAAEKLQAIIDDIKEQKTVEITVEDVSKKTEQIAKEFNIEAAVTKATSDAENLITAKSKSKNPPTNQVLGAVKNGTIGTTTKAKAEEESKRISVSANSKKDQDKVAIYSTKSVRWSGVGDISRGYNIVSKTEAEKWFTRGHVRLATPDEIEREFGK